MMSDIIGNTPKIAVIGLGYVGLPLAVAFAKKYSVIGFDLNSERIQSLEKGNDITSEVSTEELADCSGLNFTDQSSSITACDVYIVTVPTPVDEDKRPNLKPLKAASKTVGQSIQKGGVVIYESTVFPGATEEVCIPIVEKESGLIFNTDFYAGYSPERINPGDEARRITDIVKVTSGSNAKAAKAIDNLYASVITAGTYSAASIKVAESAKVIENTQRDLNIALINELAIIFNKLNIDTEQVLQAAGTKWNFLPFKPGLVGGHCIGVDPYYLTHKAERIGYRPEVILAGRRINDAMSHYVAGRIIKLMIKKGMCVASSRILVLGLTFKENCPDVRNSKVVDLISELKDFGATVDVYDPVADQQAAKRQHDIELLDSVKNEHYDAAVVAVNHLALDEKLHSIVQFLKPSHVIYDIKHALDTGLVDERL